MNRQGRPRRELLVTLARQVSLDGVVVDVGADHGHVAHALGAIATERRPDRRGRTDVPWVVADGLAPFRHVDVAIIAGMGARTIIGILERGPSPRRALVLHAPDDPPMLRRWLAAHGWHLQAEGLAPEAGRFAEVLLAVPGRETATGHRLDLGPALSRHGHPLLEAHLDVLVERLAQLARDTGGGRSPARHARTVARLAYVRAWRTRLRGG